MNSIKLCPFSSKVQICLECSKCILWKNSGDKPICTLRHPGSTIPFEPPSSPNIRLASGLWTDRNSLQQNIGLCQKIYDCKKEISELYLATNTDSVILINQLAGFNLRPKRLIGFFHYFKGENGYSLQESCAMVELQVLSDRTHPKHYSAW